MADNDTKPITKRELREAELQMTGRPPATATGFIGFRPAVPGNGQPPRPAAATESASPTSKND